MKVALVHEWLVTFAGSEQVLKAISEIYPKADIFVVAYNQERVPQFKSKKVNTSFIQKLPLAGEKPQIYLPLHLLAFESYDLTDYDLVISSSHAFAKGVKTTPETLHICYCHYPLRYVWEPGVDPRLSSNPIYKGVAKVLKPLDLKAANRPNFYIANSKNTASKIKKHYSRNAKVIYPPVDLKIFKPVKSPSLDYFLLAGRMIKYKNPQVVIETFNRLGWKLIVVGSGPEIPRLVKIAKKNIKFMGRVSDKKLANLYANCKALIFPGEEDFGIVPVEVMASGRPVLALGRGGVVESVKKGICGDFFNVPDPDNLIRALKKFDPDRYDSVVLRKNALQFGVERFKKEFKKLVNIEYNRKRKGKNGT